AAKSLEVALTAPVSLTTILLAVGLAVAGGLIAGAFGGWRASRLRPADALRRVE
ncbi:ABC transporter permease, partial [Streptomyces sp. SID4946]